jgi:DNA-binding HxlR family transcriptional regulator
MKWREIDQQACSLARTAALLGDRWTLVILRDCFLKVRRFEAFQSRNGLTRPLLSARLKRLVEAGILTRVAYQAHPPRHEYRLTPKGRDLQPVILALVHWGDMHLAGEAGRPLLHRHAACGHLFDPVTTCSVCGDPVTPETVSVEPGPGAVGTDETPYALG